MNESTLSIQSAPGDEKWTEPGDEKRPESGKKKRSAYWDNIKGILILLVVFAHFLYGLQSRPANNLIVDSIYFFHMPAFVFVSGFFSKSEHSRSRESLLKLLLAYFFLHGFFLFTRGANPPRLLGSYYSEWYLIAMIIWRITVPTLCRSKHALLISVALSLIAGFWPDLGGNTTFDLRIVVTFLPYFVAGYMLQADSLKGIRKKRPDQKAIGAGIFLLIVILLEYLARKFLPISDQTLTPNAYSEISWREPAARMSILLVSIFFILLLLHISKNKKIPLLTAAGRNSLSIYLIHRPITLLVSNHMASLKTGLQIVISIVGTVLIALLFGSDFVSKYVNAFLNACVQALTAEEKKPSHIFLRGFLILLLCLMLLAPLFGSSYVKIISQPTDVSVNEGETASFTVSAKGNNLKYQWQYYGTDGKWYELTNEEYAGRTEATMSVLANSQRNGHVFRCAVSSNSKTVFSDEVTLTVGPNSDLLSIIVQPQSVTAAEGETASFTVSAKGEDLHYQWQYYGTDGKWYELTNEAYTGRTDATLSVLVESHHNGHVFRCAVSNSAGTVYSDAVTLTVK